MTDQKLTEPVIEPDLPIVDAHHRLRFQPQAVLAATARRLYRLYL